MRLTDSVLHTLAVALRSATVNDGLSRKDLRLAKGWVASELRSRAVAEKKANQRLPRYMSKSRREWLTSLAENGPQRRGQGKAPKDCSAFGWTEWDILLPDGTPILEREARMRFGDEWPRSVQVLSTEHITQAGLDALAGSRENDGTYVSEAGDALPTASI